MKSTLFFNFSLMIVVMASLFIDVGRNTSSADADLPLLGDNAVLNINREIELGRGLYQKLRENGFVIDDPLLSRYVSDIGESLLASMDIRIRDYHFYLVKDSSVNAFATPGGYIGINVGLISMSRSEDELASVLAHEIAHVRLMHSMQLLDKARDANLAGMISILAAILVSGHDSDLASALIYTGAAGSAQSMVNFTRANEYEADRVGIGLLQQSDYNPSAMADFMRLLQSREQSGALANIEYIRTHPVNSNRIAEIESRIQGAPARPVKARRFEQFRDYLAYQYPQLYLTQRSSAFYRALEDSRNGQYVAAERIIRQLIKTDPDSIWYSYALAENLQHQNRLAEAENIYRSMFLLYPDDFAIGLRLARVLIRQGRAQPALNVILSLLPMHEQQVQLYLLLFEAHSALGNTLLSQLAEADYQWFNGNRERAKKLYKVLLDQAALDAQNEEKVRTRLSAK